MTQNYFLAVQYRRSGQIFFRGIVDEETASVLYGRNDLLGHFGGDGRTTKGRSHHTVFMQDPQAHIRSAVDHDIPPVRMVVETFIDTIDPQRKAVAAEIRITGHIKTQAALAGFIAVGE